MFTLVLCQRLIPLTYIKRHSPNIYSPAVCTKEQNDQIQESDAGASVGVSGQNQQLVTVCSMFCHFVSGTLVAPSGKQGNYHSSLQSC